jgi:Amt family ammonium transporter
MVGKRKGWGRDAFMPHNVSMTVLGAGILWVGWFGFNAGSALAADGIATVALFGTQVAAGAAAFSWMMTEWKMDGRPTALGAASGGVAGLVAITPAAGFVGPVAAVIIGLVGGVLCCLGLKLKTRYGYDDALDVVDVHGIGGLWGALATGLFASTAINPGGADGLFYGNPEQLWIQLVGAVVVIAFSLIMSTILFKLTDKLVGLRVSEEEEIQGLDITQHSEVGYTL